MESIKFYVDVNVNLSEQTIKFLSTLFGSNNAQPTAVTAKPIAVQPVHDAVVTAASTVDEVVKEQADEKPVQSEVNITIDMLRKELASKVNEHRAEIKQKLTEFGAPSITKLEEAKYPEMYDFLTSL